jgi:hypothetical protein
MAKYSYKKGQGSPKTLPQLCCSAVAAAAAAAVAVYLFQSAFSHNRGALPAAAGASLTLSRILCSPEAEV